MRLALLVVLAAACRDPEPLERLPAPASTAVPLDELPPPPPPPPRPPIGGREPMPPPVVVSDFLAAHAADAKPWTASVFELAEPGRQFLGYRVRRRRALAPEQAMELAARLGQDTSYTTDDILGYSDPPFGFELARGRATFRFLVNAGHLVLGPRDEGHPVFSQSMIDYLDRLRARPGG
jgi:hypothetical protein